MSYFTISQSAPTITDWIQTGVYLLTAVGLFVNFWYQRKTLAEQTRLRLIEEERDRRKIMPLIEFSHSSSRDTKEFMLSFTIKDNPGKFLFVNPTDPTIGQYNLVITDFKPEQTFLLRIPEEIMNHYSKKSNKEGFYEISYMDKDNRPYQQHLHITYPSMYLSDPMEYYYVMKMNEAINKRSLKQRISDFFKHRKN